MTMTTIPSLCGLCLALVLGTALGHTAAAEPDANGGALPTVSETRIESAAMGSRPVLLAWDLRRFFGGSERKPETQKEERKPVAPAPPRESPAKPQPAPPQPVAPSAPPAVPPVPKGAIPAPESAPHKTGAPERTAPKVPTGTGTKGLRPPSPTAAVTPPAKEINGELLARRVYDRDTGHDAVATVEMVLTSRSGQTRVRRFDSETRRHDGLQDSLIRFIYPPDIEDTAFLTLERAGDDAEQFLYLPALRRVRRIVAKQKGKSFVNSDLYYQDLERRAPNKDRHRIVGQQRVGDWQCWILQSIPKEEDSSAYGKTLLWIDQATLVPVKGETFDRKGKKIKTTVVDRLEQVGGIWTVMDSEVTTLENQHTTRLTVQDVRYNTGLSDDNFTKRALQK